VHGTHDRNHTRGGPASSIAGRLGVSVAKIVVAGTERVGADGTVHGPGGHLHAVKRHGHQQGEQVHVVHVVVVGTTVVGGVGVVVVVRTRPQGGQAHVLVELVGGGHGSHVVIQDAVGVGGKAGQRHALDAHADLQVGLGHDPVDISVLHFHNLAVGTEGAALVRSAPHLVADFKEHGAGQGFGSHGVHLQAHALGGFKLVLAVFAVASGGIAAGEGAVLAVIKAHDPLTFGLEIDGAGARGSAKHQTGRQQKSSDLFHGYPSFLLPRLGHGFI